MSSSDDKREIKRLRNALADIISGSSKLKITPNKSSSLYDSGQESFICYAKHFNFWDQLELDKKYDEAYDRAERKGMPRREDVLKELDESGQWTSKDELSWGTEKSFLENMIETKAKTIVPAQIKAMEKNIKKQEEKVREIESNRNTLIGKTCESHADSRISSLTIITSLYKDKGLRNRLFTDEESEYLDNNDYSVLIEGYNSGVEYLATEKLQHISLSGFFSPYFSIVENNPIEMFGVNNVCDLTFYQLNLISYAKMFRSIIKHTNPPKHFLNDPGKLMEWSEKGEKARKLMEKAQDKSKDFSVVGAKSSEYKDMGVEKEGGVDLFQLAAKRGKDKKGGASLGIMDFV